MPIRIDGKAAALVLRQEAATDQPVDPAWAAKVEQLSQLCETGTSKTHIAFLGTEMLAKTVDARADLKAIKPTHATDRPNAYSARSLCHSVLVPLSAELGFSLGVSGREPLNNQPYFRMNQLGDDTPVHPGGRRAFDYMIELVEELQFASSSEAREALRAFISVRRGYQRRYGAADGLTGITPEKLLAAISVLVAIDSEGGRRAQAVAAGLLDVVAGTGRVESGRINDPSRHYPGDVAVLAAEAAEGKPIVFEKAFEVRDKPVRFSDVAIFGRLCVDRGVQEAAMVLVSPTQQPIWAAETGQWATQLGISMTIFVGWDDFVNQCLFWAPLAKPFAATLAVETIRDRLVSVEVSSETVATWDNATRA
jgi:hypothetical protein